MMLEQHGFVQISKADIPARLHWAIDRNTPASATEVAYRRQETNKTTNYAVEAFDGATWHRFAMVVSKRHAG